SELHLATDFPRALRNRHGRGMGSWRISGNGNVANCSTRIVLGNLTTRVRFRLSAGGHCVLDRVSILRVARSFHSRGVTRISCALHPDEGARVAGLAAAAARGE